MIDFEATAKLIQKDRSGTHRCHPICTKCMGYAHRYVEAALGDKVLLRFATKDDADTYIEAEVVQVWPKEET